MKRSPLYALAACALAVTSPLAAQDAPSIFDRLEGQWHGDGTLMGRDAQFTMTWERHDGLAVLTFANAFVDPGGTITPVLHAVAVYRVFRESPEAVWLDSRGVRIEIRWKMSETSDSVLIAHWTAPTESGRTTYRVVSAEEIEVVDDVASGERWRTFGTARYRRGGAPGW